MQGKMCGTFKESHGITVPDGTYRGTWTAYSVCMLVGKQCLTFYTDVGVRGIEVPAQVVVNDNRATVRTIRHVGPDRLPVI